MMCNFPFNPIVIMSSCETDIFFKKSCDTVSVVLLLYLHFEHICSVSFTLKKQNTSSWDFLVWCRGSPTTGLIQNKADLSDDSSHTGYSLVTNRNGSLSVVI